jgi:peroxiredoxin
MRGESDTLKPGDRAPDFALVTQRGDRRVLADYLAVGHLVLTFHRGTW